MPLCFIALKKVVVQIILQRDSYCLRKWRYDYYNYICLQYWFKKFRAGNFEKWRQQPPNKDLIKAMLTENPRYSVQEMPLIFLEQKIWSEWGISIDIKFGFHNRLYESRLYVRLTSLAIWKRSFLKEACMSPETRFGFCIKMCMKNAFCPRIIDFQLGEAWTSPEENFVHLMALKRWYYNLLRVPFSKLANIALILPNTAISLINWQLP